YSRQGRELLLPTRPQAELAMLQSCNYEADARSSGRNTTGAVATKAMAAWQWHISGQSAMREERRKEASSLRQHSGDNSSGSTGSAASVLAVSRRILCCKQSAQSGCKNVLNSGACIKNAQKEKT